MIYTFATSAPAAQWYDSLVHLVGSDEPVYGQPTAPGEGHLDGDATTIRVTPPASTSFLAGGWPPRRMTLAVEGAEIAGLFAVGTVPADAAFEATIASVAPGHDHGTRFAVRVRPADGSAGWTEVANRSLTQGTSATLVGDLSTFAGTSVIVALVTASEPARTTIGQPTHRTWTAPGRSTGVWTRARLGSRIDLATVSVRLRLTGITILAAIEPEARLGPPVSATDQPVIAGFAYAVDAIGVSEPATATPPTGPTIRATELDIGADLPFPLSAYPGSATGSPAPHLFIGWSYPTLANRPLTLTCRRMGGTGDPGASFVGFVMLCFEENTTKESDRDVAVTHFRSAFLAAANQALAASLPSGGPATGLTTAASTALRSTLSGIAASLSNQLVTDLPGQFGHDGDQIVGIAHLVWTQSELEAGPGAKGALLTTRSDSLFWPDARYSLATSISVL